MTIPQNIVSEFPDILSNNDSVIIFWLSISGNSSEKPHRGNVVSCPEQMATLTGGPDCFTHRV